MRDALLWLVVFALTIAETWVATAEGRADRQATTAKHNRFSLTAAHWAAAFEALLLIDIILIAKESIWLGVPIIIGAWLGKYAAVERRRRKWRRNAGRKLNLRKKSGQDNMLATPTREDSGAAPGECTADATP